MSGQILDATLIAAPKQRNRENEKAQIKAGTSAAEIWPGEPARAAQKDVDARWTVKFAKARPAADGKPQIDIAIPTFGYKSHISIDRRHGVIRRQMVTDAAAHDGARLREGLIDPNNRVRGNSFSGPHVSGTVALMFEANPRLTAMKVKQILESTAKDIAPPGKDNRTGAGLLDAYEAVLAAKRG